MNPQINAVIFDLDGLLINSESAWDKAYFVFLKKHNVIDKPEISEKMTGMGLKDAIKIMIDELGLIGDVDELTEDYRQLFYDVFLKEKHVLMQGAGDLVQKLTSKYQLAVATGGHTSEKCSQILKNIGIDKYFRVIVSSDDVNKGKPAPDVYLETARHLGVQPLKCLVLEDAVNGVLAAKAAGMLVYGVNADKKIRAELKKAGADEVYSSLKELTGKFST